MAGSEADLAPDVLAEIEADVARYRAARIQAALKRRGITPGFVTLTLVDLSVIARRWLAGETKKAIAQSLDDWDPVALSGALHDFAWCFQIEWSYKDQRGAVTEALAKFDRGDSPDHLPYVRRHSPSQLAKRRSAKLVR